MDIKGQKGFTGADVTVAVLIITIFAGIIASLYQNYTLSSKQIERKTEATNYAVEAIEEIKANANEYLTGDNESKEVIQVYENTPIGNTGYSKTVTLEDYKQKNEEANVGYVKLVEVTIKYKVGNKDETVELSTTISKES